MIAIGAVGFMQAPKAYEDKEKDPVVILDKTGIPRHIIIDRERSAKRKAEYWALNARMKINHD